MRIAKVIPVLVALLLTCAPVWADGLGLSTDSDRLPWARFQWRLSYSATIAPSWRNDFAGGGGAGLKLSAFSVMGDMYFGPSNNSHPSLAGGFRATSGLVGGARNTLWGATALAPVNGLFSVDRRLFGQSPGVLPVSSDAGDSATIPYVGIGYSSLASGAGWSFSADLGLMSLTPGAAVRLGRVFGGGQNLDDVVHDMRLAPVLQFGASYSF